MRGILLIFVALFFHTFTSCKKDEKISYAHVKVYDYQIWLSNLNKKYIRDSTVAVRKSISSENTTLYGLVDQDKDSILINF